VIILTKISTKYYLDNFLVARRSDLEELAAWRVSEEWRPESPNDFRISSTVRFSALFEDLDVLSITNDLLNSETSAVSMHFGI